MSKVVLDAATRAKLRGLTDMLEIYDDAGNLLGYYTPLVDSLMGGQDDAAFSDAEVAEALKDTDEGRPLADILRDLGAR